MNEHDQSPMVDALSAAATVQSRDPVDQLYEEFLSATRFAE